MKTFQERVELGLIGGLFIGCLIVMLVLLCSSLSEAQTLGTWKDKDATHGVVSCPHTAPIALAYKMRKGSKGTIVFFNGGPGTTMGGGSHYDMYAQAGYTTVSVAWSSTWELTGTSTKDLGVAACRGATVLQHFYSLEPGAHCAQGYSAGSSAIAFAMSRYGIEPDAVEFLSGPVMSDVDKGCTEPDVPATVIKPTSGAVFANFPQYQEGNAAWLTQITGYECQPQYPHETKTSQAASRAWKAQSIVNAAAKLSYKTHIAGWLCDNGMNNSAGQGGLYYPALTSPYTLTRISGCTAPENVQQGKTPAGVLGNTAIYNDMIAACHK